MRSAAFISEPSSLRRGRTSPPKLHFPPGAQRPKHSRLFPLSRPKEMSLRSSPPKLHFPPGAQRPKHSRLFPLSRLSPSSLQPHGKNQHCLGPMSYQAQPIQICSSSTVDLGPKHRPC